MCSVKWKHPPPRFKRQPFRTADNNKLRGLEVPTLSAATLPSFSILSTLAYLRLVPLWILAATSEHINPLWRCQSSLLRHVAGIRQKAWVGCIAWFGFELLCPAVAMITSCTNHRIKWPARYVARRGRNPLISLQFHVTAYLVVAKPDNKSPHNIRLRNQGRWDDRWPFSGKREALLLNRYIEQWGIVENYHGVHYFPGTLLSNLLPSGKNNWNSLVVCDESGHTKFPFSFAILSWGKLGWAVADLSWAFPDSSLS